MYNPTESGGKSQQTNPKSSLLQHANRVKSLLEWVDDNVDELELVDKEESEHGQGRHQNKSVPITHSLVQHKVNISKATQKG